MPGKPFRSSLEPHFDEIPQRRARRETWQGIAAELEKSHGLKVHFSAVQKFFGRYQARPRPLGFAPLPTTTTAAAAPTPAIHASSSVIQPSPSTAGVPPVPIFEDADHDPLGGPIDPDAENPFKMRKRQAQRSRPT